MNQIYTGDRPMTAEEESTEICLGCKYDEDIYQPECTGCRRKMNIYFNTPEEPAEFVVLPDKHTGVGEVVTYGVTKILKRSKDM